MFSVYDMREAHNYNDRRERGDALRTTGGEGYVYTETGGEWDQKIARMPGVRKIGEWDAPAAVIEEMARTCEDPAPAWYIGGTRHQPTQRCPFLPPRLRK